MAGPEFREPVSAWTHLAWLALAVPGLWLLWLRAGGDPVKRRVAVVFGGALVFCSAGSFLFHAVPPEFVAFCRAVDHVGIYLLIAGTVTPIGVIVLDGWWRLGLVGGIWILAAVGVSLRAGGLQSVEVMTACYLFMGWVGCVSYCELARRLTHAGMRPLWMGGVFYTTGAVLNGLQWPDLVPGVFGPHELFHLFVVAGSAWHYDFIFNVVLPYSPRRVEAAAIFLPSPTALRGRGGQETPPSRLTGR